MSSPTRALRVDDVERFAREEVFAPRATGRVGIELEWFTRSRDGTVPGPEAVRRVLPAALPWGARVTFEPGGQLELSGSPAVGIAAACAAIAADADAVRAALAAHGVDLTAIGLDPSGARPRVVDAPRYRAMERYFDSVGPAGRTMMRSTASIQVNVDTGASGDVERRWRLAHDVGPVLTAMFANSPFDSRGRPTGWRSTRQAVWAAVDPCRTAPITTRGPDPVDAWLAYALDAPVMMIRTGDDRYTALEGAFPFGRWLGEGHELGWPTLDDFAYHLTTLFPPVRARGWLELRMIDSVPDSLWPVAVAVAAALLDDAEASALAARATGPVRDAWTVAARDGVANEALRDAALACGRAALAAYPRLGVGPAIVEATERFLDTTTSRGRCPADDRLDEWARRRAATA